MRAFVLIDEKRVVKPNLSIVGIQSHTVSRQWSVLDGYPAMWMDGQTYERPHRASSTINYFRD